MPNSAPSRRAMAGDGERDGNELRLRSGDVIGPQQASRTEPPPQQDPLPDWTRVTLAAKTGATGACQGGWNRATGPDPNAERLKRRLYKARSRNRAGRYRAFASPRSFPPRFASLPLDSGYLILHLRDGRLFGRASGKFYTAGSKSPIFIARAHTSSWEGENGLSFMASRILGMTDFIASRCSSVTLVGLAFT
jgi:hypothetical protein